LGLLTLNALTAARTVLIPIQCEYYALEGLGRLMETIERVQKVLNPTLTLEGILLTMFDSRLNLSEQVAEEARHFFGSRVFNTVIPRNVRLGEAPSFGKPVTTYDPHCIGAASYYGLAKEMIGDG
jgi:chromosome partitioning protein